jgi:ribose transport system ATP-binding protein
MGPPILRMTGIDKRFGPVTALSSVDFSLEHGEIHALLGVNGAGKSTLVKILSGVYVKDAGVIEIDGERVEIGSPADAIDRGVASVQQHPEMIGDLSGYENIFLGQEGSKPGLFRRFDRSGMARRAAALLARFPVDADLAAPVSRLSSVAKEIVAVLHALLRNDAKILILDEPTSTLTTVEKVQLFAMMRALKAAGVAIVYITHRLEEVFEIADRFTVFRNGKNVGTYASAEASRRKISIPRLMLEGDLGDLYPAKLSDVPRETLLEVYELARRNEFAGVSFELRRGEILGVFGLVGSGIEELAKTLFGALQPDGGEIRLRGRLVKFQGPRDALRRGLFLVPGDRRSEGLVMSRNVTFNATLAHLQRASWLGGLLKFRDNRREIASLAADLELRPPHLWRAAAAFSGGNQQKIVVAKGLFRQAEVYLVVEPTIGVDVGARARLYALLRKLSESAGVLVLSSDCDEVFGLGDRVMALYKGRVVCEPKRGATRDELLAAGISGAAT